MKGLSSPTTDKAKNKGGLIRALIVLGASATILLVSIVLWSTQANPYIKATLSIEGSADKGGRLFRVNCAGCHGVKAQGLLAPNLNEVTNHHKDSEIINQIVQGKTPPMPSFQIQPEDMADLLSYLHKIN